MKTQYLIGQEYISGFEPCMLQGLKKTLYMLVFHYVRMRPAQKGWNRPAGWAEIIGGGSGHANFVTRESVTGYKSRGDPVTVQENPPCPGDRIVTPVLAVTIASMRVTTPCRGHVT